MLGASRLELPRRPTGAAEVDTDATLGPCDLLTEGAHIEGRVRLPARGRANFLVSEHARGRQFELGTQRPAQLGIGVHLLRRPRAVVAQAGVLSLDADGVRVRVGVTAHPSSMVGDASGAQVDRAVAGEENLRQRPGQAGATIGDNVEARGIARSRPGSVVRNDGLD